MIEFIRMDAGFAGDKVYLEAEEHAAIGYVVKTPFFASLRTHAACFLWWRAEHTVVIIEVKSFMHRMKDWSKPRRIVMVRYRPADEETAGQGRLLGCLWQTVVLVRHAREALLKLSADYPWQKDYVWMRRRLEALDQG